MSAIITRPPVDYAAADAAWAAMQAANKAARTNEVKTAAITAPPEWHGLNGGECPNTLDTLPVFLRYELTMDRGGEVAEVTDVLIFGHVISATDFADDIRAEWGRQCMTARGGL